MDLLERIKEAVGIADELRDSVRIAVELKVKLATLHAECARLTQENAELRKKVEQPRPESRPSGTRPHLSG